MYNKHLRPAALHHFVTKAKEGKLNGTIDQGLTVAELLYYIAQELTKDPDTDVLYSVLYGPNGPLTEITSGQGMEYNLHFRRQNVRR